MEKKGGGEKKEEEEAVEVKLDMHCEGCALKVRKAVKGFEGNARLSTLDFVLEIEIELN